MMKNILKIIVFILSMSVAFGKGDLIITEKGDKYSSFLLGDENGNVYYAENIEEMRPLASLTKMMSLSIVYDSINAGKLKLTDKIVADKEMSETGGSRIAMRPGRVYTVDDLIKGAALHSANNAIYGLAKKVSKNNISNFVKRMNKKSKKMGLQNELKFYTPTGLPPDMTEKNMDIGSAKGVYLFSIKMAENKKYMRIASMKKAKINVGIIENRNKLLGQEGIYGIKTGHHEDAGYNISIVSEKNGMKIFVVVLGAKTAEERDAIVLERLATFYEEYEKKEILSVDKPLDKVDVIGGKQEIVDAFPDKNYELIVKKDSDIEVKIDKIEEITAPVYAGEKLGTYSVFINGELKISGNLVARKKNKTLPK